MGREFDLQAFVLAEYECLKAEQTARISHRDNLLYATLGVVGAVSYFGFGGGGSSVDSQLALKSLLLIPWATLILGWSYLVNDKKVSRIRDYIKSGILSECNDPNAANLPAFQWERAHRSGSYRSRYKVIQVLVDMATFVFSGLFAIWGYWYFSKTVTSLGVTFIVLACAAMLLLAAEFLAHYTEETK